MKEKISFREIWNKIDILLMLVVIWSLMIFLIPLESYICKTFLTIMTWIIQIGVFLFLGYDLASIKKSVAISTKTGAYLGVIMGICFAIINLLAFYFFPEIYMAAIEKAVQAGADMNTVNLFIKIGLYFNLIFTPLLMGAIGAFITWASFSVFKNKA